MILPYPHEVITRSATTAVSLVRLGAGQSVSTAFRLAAHARQAAAVHRMSLRQLLSGAIKECRARMWPSISPTATGLSMTSVTGS